MKRPVDTSHLVRRLRARCLDSGSGDEADAATESRAPGSMVQPLGDAERSAAVANPATLASHLCNWFDVLRFVMREPIPMAELLRFSAGEVPIRMAGLGAPPTVNALVRAVSSASACSDPTLLGCRPVERSQLANAFPMGPPPGGAESRAPGGCRCEGRLGHLLEVDSVCPGCLAAVHAACTLAGVCRDCVDCGSMPMGLFHVPSGALWKFHSMQFDISEPRLGAVTVDLVLARFHCTTLTRMFIVPSGGVAIDLPAPVFAANELHRRDGVLESTLVLRALVQSGASAAARREAARREAAFREPRGE